MLVMKINLAMGIKGRYSKISTLVLLLVLNTALHAEFRIGVWQPGGLIGIGANADTSFTQTDVDSLESLGIDLLINTPGVSYDRNRVQDFEESIISQWNGSGGFVVHKAAGDIAHSNPTNTWYDNLTRFAGDITRFSNPLSPDQETLLDVVVDSLESKWGDEDAFYGYQIGHESDYQGHGIYDSDTYDNMVTVINTIRDHDTEHRIIAIGNTTDSRWTSTEQDSFRTHFFGPDSLSVPANIFMQEIYELHPNHDNETEVQEEFREIISGLGEIGDMVRTALNEDRKAEWHFIPNVADQWNDSCRVQFRRGPTYAELKAQVNLALSRGAKGVTYFLYTSSDPDTSIAANCLDDNYRYDGLVEHTNPNRNKRDPHWNNVEMVNDTLRVLGDVLAPLTWEEAFPGSDIPTGRFVEAVGANDDSFEFGTFTDSDDNYRDYLLVVNKYDLWAGTTIQTVDITIDVDDLESSDNDRGMYVVTDEHSGNRQVHSTDSNGRFVLKDITLAAGAARLFKIEETASLSDTLSNEELWSGDIAVSGDVTVPSGATLTIEPGSTIQFAADSDDQSGPPYPGLCAIKVHGTLVTEGTSTNQITFESDATSPERGDWDGILFWDSSVDSLCRVNHAVI